MLVVANSHQETTMEESFIGAPYDRKNLELQETAGKSYITHLNTPIYCMPTAGSSRGEYSHSSPMMTPMTTTTTMQSNHIDDGENHHQQATCSINQTPSTWRGNNSTSSLRNYERTAKLGPTSTQLYNRHLMTQTSAEEDSDFDNDLFLEHYCPSGFQRLQGQGYTGSPLMRPRPQTSMDRRAEYLARRQMTLVDMPTSPHVLAGQTGVMCHRQRNASYSSSARISNPLQGSNLHQDAYKRPSTGTPIAATGTNRQQHTTRATMGSCSPSSSGSLPASVQRSSNWCSYSDSFDHCSLGEPISLPLIRADRKSPLSVATKQFHRYQQQQQQQQSSLNAAQYRWQPKTYDLSVDHHRLERSKINRQIFNQSIDKYSHKFQGGSDSELYSHNQQHTYSRHNQTALLPALMNDLSAVLPHARDRCELIHRNTSDNLKSVRSLKQTSEPLSTKSHQVSTNMTTTTMTSKSTNTKLQPTGSGSFKKGGSNSNKLSLAGAKRRLGFKQKGLVSLSVQRCEEVLPSDGSYHFRMISSSFADSRNNSSSIWRSQQQTQSEPIDPRINFMDGLGAGQIASRQALVSPYLGDIQLTLSDRRGMLEVEVVRARGLQLKPAVKTLPSPYVKLYLMKNKKCLAKSKTLPVRRTLDPLYQQQFIFRENYTDCILQVIVWGDYGKKDRKSLMGIVQIRLDDLDISNLVIDWYRLFNAPSMADSLLSSRALRQMILTKTIDTN